MSSGSVRQTSPLCSGSGSRRRVCNGTLSGVSWQHILSVVTIIVLVVLPCVGSIEWLAMANGKQKSWNNTKHCSRRRTPGLVKSQVQICKRNLELMPIVGHASQDVMDVCEEIFVDNRWNCSTIRESPNYLADLTGGSREQAFVFALSSAAITQAVSKACSVGVTAKCGCGRLPNEPPPGEFKWGGCGDDVRFGLMFSETFTDMGISRKRKESRKELMNKHNSAVGRKMVQDSLTTACKCHGVSGSCSIKTCWMALPEMRGVGASLQKRYAVAVEVKKRKQNRGKRQKTMGMATHEESTLVSITPSRRRYTETDLVYYTKSPDYCYPDPSLGSLGTHGRECQKDQHGSGGCKSMCCGRGYTSEIVRVRHRCDCKYYWCCYVKCKTCTKEVEINRCT